MSEPKHTPGPWKFEDVSGSGLQIFAPIPFKAECGEFVLKDCYQPTFSMAEKRVGTASKSHPEGYPMIAYETWLQFPEKRWNEMQEANARLMAAAPDLLEACKNTLEYFETTNFCQCGEECGCIVGEMRRAIAKAEGRS